MRVRFLLAVAVALLANTSLAAASDAEPYRVKDLRVISGPSPFAAGCPGARFDDTTITDHELEPAITVNPDNPRNLVATWKQDVGPASARSDLVASSLDGGKTWTRRTIPGLTVCTGGTADGATDPWVAAGGDGTVYFSGLTGDLSTEPLLSAVVASRSRDGGRSWPAPATVAAPLVGNETDAVTGSPTAGRARLPGLGQLPRGAPEDQLPGVFAHDRRRRQLVAPGPDRPAGSVRRRLLPQDPGAAGRHAAGCLRARRCRAWALPVLRRPLAG